MKANVLLSGVLAATVLSACAPRTPPPAPAPPPPPVATATAAPQPAPRPLGDWRDVPLTPGTWRWSSAAGQSAATFGFSGQAPLVTLACVAPGTVQLRHAGTVAGAAPVGVTASAGTFPLMSDAVAPGATGVTVTLPARARVLDAIAFSRGRFVIEVAGLAPSYLPAWPEVSRVVEDCR